MHLTVLCNMPTAPAHLRMLFSTFILCVFSPFSFANASDYADVGIPETEIFNSIDHQGTAVNWGLIQSNKGFIYAGNGRGLSEWDGENWAIYTTTNKTVIFSLTQWKDKRLYVGSLNDIGYFSDSNTGRLEYSSLVEAWPVEQRQFGMVTSTVSNDSSVLFTTNNATYRWDGQQLALMKDMPRATSALFVLSNNYFYQAVDDPYIYKITPEMDISRTQLRLPEGAKVRSIVKSINQQLVVFTAESGVFVELNGALEQIITPAMFGQQLTLYSGIQAKDGYYYVSTVSHGIFIINDTFKVVRHYTQNDDLGSNSVHHLMEDNQGNIWLSGMLNITKMVPPHRYSRYRIEGQSRLSNHLKLINNKVVIAGEGIYELSNNNPPLSPPHFRQKLNNTKEYWDFLEYEGHFIYAGVGGIFAQALNSQTFDGPTTTIVKAQQGRSLFINTRTNSLFAGTNIGLHEIKRANGQWQTRVIDEVVGNIQSMNVDENNILWAGTPAQVLYKIEPQDVDKNAKSLGEPLKVSKYTGADGLGANNVIPFKLSTGLLIGTNDGAMRYNTKQQVPLEFVSGFPPIFTTPGQDVYRLFEDPYGRIWYRIGDYSGYIFKDETHQWKAQDMIFGPLPKHSYKGFLVTQPNILWFIMNGGLVYRSKLDLLESFPEQAKLHIRDIINLSTLQTISGGLRLPILDQMNNSIRINYALTDYASLNPTQYRHRLLGSAYEEWSPWSHETAKDFTQLHGTDYQFQVQAKDSWGRVSQTELLFTVLPPWYLSTLAMFLYVFCILLALVLSGWFSQKWRTASLEKQKEALEMQVALRTQEILDKNDALKESQAKLKRSTTSAFSQALTKHVQAHLHNTELSVELLADLMHMTSKTLARKCKKDLGVSPLAYIIQLRMERAVELLNAGDLSISEIAYSLGYESLAYFSNSFKKYTGKAPSEYKN